MRTPSILRKHTILGPMLLSLTWPWSNWLHFSEGGPNWGSVWRSRLPWFQGDWVAGNGMLAVTPPFSSAADGTDRVLDPGDSPAWRWQACGGARRNIGVPWLGRPSLQGRSFLLAVCGISPANECGHSSMPNVAGAATVGGHSSLLLAGGLAMIGHGPRSILRHTHAFVRTRDAGRGRFPTPEARPGGQRPHCLSPSSVYIKQGDPPPIASPGGSRTAGPALDSVVETVLDDERGE